MGDSMNVIDVMSDNLTAWDGEEDSVREKHAELIEATRACLASVDASLIAAAPDLLAACQAVLDEFPAMDGRRIESVKAICRAAIARATGDA